ncbi:MAG: 1,4-alpha-glucan branching enzyme [Oceanospirillaceae bacterium]|nr:1,4-alpha-glucan branching enzyme [Oceanospirillaceae bacterium]
MANTETAEHISDFEHLQRLQTGLHHDPFLFLGCHPAGDSWIIRSWLPMAEQVWVGDHALTRLGDTGCFAVTLTDQQRQALPQHYEVRWQEGDDEIHTMVSPWTFWPQLGELDLHLFAEGRHWNIHQHLGAQLKTLNGVEGVLFAVWAPSATRVSVVGSFNNWNGLRHPMRALGGSGVWELFIPGLHAGDLYKFEIRNEHTGDLLLKTDPYARYMEKRPDNSSVVFDSQHQWSDAEWMRERDYFEWQHRPISIYEVHLGSWRRDELGNFLSYRAIAHELVNYVKWMGFTHIELLPLSEHPLDQSWGYQTSGYFAPTSRFGNPDDLRYLVDLMHQHDIGVLLDWVPAHFPKDDFALARFDGTALYEHEDPRKGEHREWGTLIFNYSRNEVRNFLIANALYWLKEFHIDGLRVDAVAAMLYLDYDREDGDWEPNAHGGRENLEAIEFLRVLNHEVHTQCPGALMMAEESTSWPLVTRPPDMGGLGFTLKWNMGWMNDTLGYFKQDPLYRSFHHNQLTFNQMYAYSENFVLPLSHDEVVHLKGSLSSRMPGDDWQKMANLRLLLAWQWLNPGKKLLFMGGEMGQWTEWDESVSLDWDLPNYDNHRGVQLLTRDLNRLYQTVSALHQYDFDQAGFDWISCDDHENSVLAFTRQSDDCDLVCVFNFTPVPRNDYPVGLPHSGDYEEILNTDSVLYGGSNVGNEGQLRSRNEPLMGQPNSALVNIPPLGVVVLRHLKPEGTTHS